MSVIKKYPSMVVMVSYGEFKVGNCTFNRRVSNLRLNSAMTKDLIKLEMRCRVMSFRPSFMDLQIYKSKLRIKEGMEAQERMLWDSSPEKLNGFLNIVGLKNLSSSRG